MLGESIEAVKQHKCNKQYTLGFQYSFHQMFSQYIKQVSITGRQCRSTIPQDVGDRGWMGIAGVRGIKGLRKFATVVFFVKNFRPACYWARMARACPPPNRLRVPMGQIPNPHKLHFKMYCPQVILIQMRNKNISKFIAAK